MYCVIVGDIIDSRQLSFEERQHTTETIEKIFMDINYNYRENILSDFGLVRGDSFEGVLFSQYKSLRIIRDIIRQVYEKTGQKLRVCAAIGELSVVSSDRNKADGPAFHVAVEELEKLKAKKSTHWLQVALKTKDDMAQPLIDTTLELLSCLTAEWTDKQRELVWSLPDYSGQQNLLSKAKQTKTSVVNKQLKAANYQEYSSAWDSLEKYLSCVEETKIVSYTDYYSVALRKYDAKRYEEAIHLFERSLELARNEFEENNSSLFPIYFNLADSCVKLLWDDIGYRERSEKYLTLSFQCLNSETKTLKYAVLLFMRGGYHTALKQIDEAIQDIWNSIQISEEIATDNYLFLAGSYKLVGELFFIKKDYCNALESFNNSLKYYQNHDEIDCVETLLAIARVYETIKKTSEAIEKYEESLKILSTYLPANNQNVINTKNKLKELKSRK